MSRAYLIYNEFQQGRLSLVEMQKAMALHIADTLQDHEPMPYPACVRIISDYAIGRVNGACGRDSVLAVKNGEWLRHVLNLFVKNKEELDTLFWARSSLLKLDASMAIARVDSVIERHKQNPFQPEEYKRGRIAQEKDSEEARSLRSKSGRQRDSGFTQIGEMK